MATLSKNLGKDFRLWIGKTATASTDADFVKIINENAINITREADVQENSTKEKGRINSSGDETAELSFDFNDIFDDAEAAEFIELAFNETWKWQVRFKDKVWIEGDFILSKLEWDAESQDVRSGSGTIVKAGDVIFRRPFRGVGSPPPEEDEGEG